MTAAAGFIPALSRREVLRGGTPPVAPEASQPEAVALFHGGRG